MNLPTVEDARATMFDTVQPLPFEDVTVAQADGRWLMGDVLAIRDQPPFDASAMDGWAVQAADVAPGAVLAIVGESAAGRGFSGLVGSGQTARISTGAPLPAGADHVVIQEDAKREGATVILQGPVTAGHIRRQGCDFRAEERLLSAGTRLNPWQLALAASAGTATLICGRRPVVAILATGDELVEPGQPIGADQIFNAGSPALAAFIVRHGGIATALTSAVDRDDAVIEAVTLATFDVLVTIGGASVGDHDRVKPALRTLGAQIRVEGVAMRPGKPVWFATLPDGRLVLGLPGNPASALVCAELFLAPLMAALQGATVESHFQTAILTAPLPANGPRDHYLRARSASEPDGRLHVTPFSDQDSSLVTVMAAANALIRRPPHAPPAAMGDAVSVLGPTL
ncbi:MAG: molybdopterin molybdenumtransferase MoeA [Alphaproteobacteria bacterium]|nr:MAG: molybdopterin molybdenumtransferase MoeA [Alphaproteobacteria bacterium]PZO38574.1 MAG: molybdopterin molybdenumtransferase MoeA [Alphaproteobacteria bacterium]